MNNRIKQLHQETLAVNQVIREHNATLENHDGEFRVNSIVAFPNIPLVRFVCVKAHPDDPQIFFMVPLDDFPLVGPCDHALPLHKGLSVMIARCNHGLWVNSLTLKKNGAYHGEISREDSERILSILSGMVTGQLDATLEQLDMETHPDYEDWEEELTGLVWKAQALQ